MEFTTRFGLHSQTTRLREDGARPEHRPAYRASTVSGGSLNLSLGGGSRAVVRLPYATIPSSAARTGIQRWARPSSLAATGGILVSFFSSAY